MAYYILVFVLCISTHWMRSNAYPTENIQQNKTYIATRNNSPSAADAVPSNSLDSTENLRLNSNSNKKDELIINSTLDSVAYPSENDDDGDLKTAHTRRFRPLYRYVAQNSQRRRYYGQPKTVKRPVRPSYMDRPFPHVT